VRELRNVGEHRWSVCCVKHRYHQVKSYWHFTEN